jgi:hypothetical protein
MRRWMVMVAVLAMAMLVGAAQAKGSKANKGEKINGKITKVDGSNVTVQPHVKKGEPAKDAVVVMTTDTTSVTINDVAKGVADLAVGQRVKVTLSADGKTATTIAVGKRYKGGAAGPAANTPAPATEPAK